MVLGYLFHFCVVSVRSIVHVVEAGMDPLDQLTLLNRGANNILTLHIKKFLEKPEDFIFTYLGSRDRL